MLHSPPLFQEFIDFSHFTYFKNPFNVLAISFCRILFIFITYAVFATNSGAPEDATITRCAEACDRLLVECVVWSAHDNLSALVVICGSRTMNTHMIQHTVSISDIFAVEKDTVLETLSTTMSTAPQSSASSSTPTVIPSASASFSFLYSSALRYDLFKKFVNVGLDHLLSIRLLNRKSRCISSGYHRVL